MVLPVHAGLSHLRLHHRTKLERFCPGSLALVGRKVAKQQFLEGLFEAAQSSIALPILDDSPAVDCHFS